MTASQKRGTIYIDLGHPARKVAEALAAPNGRSTEKTNPEGFELFAERGGSVRFWSAAFFGLGNGMD
ncbi:hypothetical protein, partial [Mesorhizobium sp.]